SYPHGCMSAAPTPPSPVRRSLRGCATVSGPTLFTSSTTSLILKPGRPDLAGIFFVRKDLRDAPRIPARHEFVYPEPRRTVLQLPGSTIRVETVEHVLSALAGLGVTDAVLEIDGSEIPVGDGSAKPFVDALIRAGLVE